MTCPTLSEVKTNRGLCAADSGLWSRSLVSSFSTVERGFITQILMLGWHWLTVFQQNVFTGVEDNVWKYCKPWCLDWSDATLHCGMQVLFCPKGFRCSLGSTKIAKSKGTLCQPSFLEERNISGMNGQLSCWLPPSQWRFTTSVSRRWKDERGRMERGARM